MPVEQLPKAKHACYVEYYRMRQPPFSLTPSGAFAYPSHSYAAARNQLLDALRRREGLVVVTGESGTGKTTLCRTVLEQLALPTVLSIVVDPFLAIEDLLNQVLDDFGATSVEKAMDGVLRRTSRHDLVIALQRFLASIVPQGVQAVVVIDDAHHLRVDVLQQLRVLANLETDKMKLLQIVLVGQRSLETLLERPDVRPIAQRIARRCIVQAMTKDEVGHYLDQQLAAAHEGAGFPSEPDGDLAEYPAESSAEPVGFTPGAIRAVAALSGGIPRTVNLICDRALEMGFEQQRSQITRRVVLKSAVTVKVPIPFTERVRGATPPMVAAATILLLAGLAWVWRPGPTPAAKSVARSYPAEIANPPATQPTPIAESSSTTPPTNDLAAVSTTMDPPGVPGTLESGDAYLIVVGSFRSEQHAAAANEKFGALELPSFVRHDSSGWHVVLIGPYASDEEARNVQKQISALDFPDSQIRREHP